METENQQWFCDICDKSYQPKGKEKHLLTKIHEKNASSKHNGYHVISTIKFSDISDFVNKTFTNAVKSKKWFCEICDKSYQPKQKEKHLLTKIHKKNEEKSNHDSEPVLDLESDESDIEMLHDRIMYENLNLGIDGFAKKDKLVRKQLEKKYGVKL